MLTVTEVCNQISVDILCGKYDDTKMLPTERVLAQQFGIGRPTIHAALVRLQNQGLIRTIPRHGWEILDLKRHGKLDLMALALSMPMADISTDFARDALTLFVASIKDIVEKIVSSGFNEFEITDFIILVEPSDDADVFASSVFHFYQRLAMRSENSVYSLLMNQFRDGILNTANLASQHEMASFRALIKDMLVKMSKETMTEAKEASAEAAYFLFNLWLSRKAEI